ncbi:MAG: glycerol-3-phosphate 1-O-acyltransferase PlsY [Candidatus Edwardsbacteria bacterium]
MNYKIILLFLLSFASGSVPFAYLIGLFYGVDIRKKGSGNVGATNVFRTVGTFPGIIALALDILKGLLPVILARSFEFVPLWQILIGLMAVIGHCFTPFLKFRGGKGVATSAGVFLGLAPLATIGVAIVWILAVLIGRYISLGSIIAGISLPIFISVISKIRQEQNWILLIFASFVSILIILRHVPNLKRLMRGSEPKVKIFRMLI